MTQMQPFDRRPIQSRDAGWSRATARRLTQLDATPNSISTAGMIFGILAGISLAATSLPSWRVAGFLLAATLIQLRLLANMFDGMVAIQSGRTSPLGELYNEIPDRVSDTAALVGCGFAWGGDLTLGYWTALLAIFVAYIRAQGRVAGAPQEYCGPMAKQHRMFVVTVCCVAAALLPVSWWPTWERFPHIGIISLGLVVILGGELITVVRRLARISSALQSDAS